MTIGDGDIKKNLEYDTVLPVTTILSTEDIIFLLHFIFCNSCLLYNEDTCKQINGYTMENPVTAVVANLHVQYTRKKIQEQASNAATIHP